jgi:predicted peroxiredoxin
MSKIVLIDSRDPLETGPGDWLHDTARDLASTGASVTVYLVQNGVLAARRGVRGDPAARILRAGVEVLADDFSLRERGVRTAQLVKGVVVAPIEVVAEAMGQGARVLWR